MNKFSCAKEVCKIVIIRWRIVRLVEVRVELEALEAAERAVAELDVLVVDDRDRECAAVRAHAARTQSRARLVVQDRGREEGGGARPRRGVAPRRERRQHLLFVPA